MNSDIVGLLNKDLQGEHAAVIQYLNHAYAMGEGEMACEIEAIGDIKRAYVLLVHEWLEYMKHLKNNYPYLFSLAMRTNPFDQDASPLVA